MLPSEPLLKNSVRDPISSALAAGMTQEQVMEALAGGMDDAMEGAMLVMSRKAARIAAGQKVPQKETGPETPLTPAPPLATSLEPPPTM